MRVVLIGATSSVGGAVKERFLDVGAQVLAVGSGEVDLTDTGSIQRLAERVDGPIDALVILAGICPGKALADYTDDEIAEVLAVNVGGPARLVKALLPHMATPGHVLAMSSISAERGSYDPIYAASKAALAGFVRSMAQRTPGVRFNAIAPGLIEGSAMWAAMSEERRAEHVRQTPTGRLMTLREVAGLIVQICGPAWSNVNGHVFAVDGGR